MNDYSAELVFAVMCLGGLLGLCIYAWVENIRDRRAAREAKKRDRLHNISKMGFRSALMQGLIDEHGNVIERVGDKQ